MIKKNIFKINRMKKKKKKEKNEIGLHERKCSFVLYKLLKGYLNYRLFWTSGTLYEDWLTLGNRQMTMLWRKKYLSTKTLKRK